MAEIQWTAQQQAAIDDRDGTLLVSAAAGSGKTAVLVERLLKRIEQENESLSRFLMITYTNAAASELRAKIAKALTKRIAQNPENKRLAREFHQLHNAKIQTVHAFCTSLLRTHGYLLGFSSDFRVMDESESDLICRALLDDLMEDWYASGEDWFSALVSAFGDSRGDRRLVQSILSLLKKSRTHPFPQKWLNEQCAPTETKNCFQTPWGNYLREHALKLVSQNIVKLERCIATMTEDLSAAYQPMFESDLEQLHALKEALLQNDWDRAYTAAHSFVFMALKSVRNPTDPFLKDLVSDTRKEVKADLGKIQSRIFTAPEAEILSDLAQVFPLAQGLVRAVSLLSDAFIAEKKRRLAMDYSDLEHYAIALLVERFENGVVTPTPLAQTLSNDFCEIMVDEYQDSNAVQDLIFRAISKEEKNIVMVGDLKQSIYRFRLADPTIFLSKYKTFQERKDARPGEPRRVDLNANFRSRPEVLDAVNHYFSLLMSEHLGDIAYDDSQKLHYERSFVPTQHDCKTELLLVETATSGEDDESALESEARAVAQKIRAMMENGFTVTDGDQMRPAEYRDFVILLRALSQKAEVFTRVLQSEGIPCVSERKNGLLSSVEVSILISLLTVIDNPLQDVPLAAALRSPLFGFTADDLAELRIASRDACYFDALQAAAKTETPLAERARNFLALLQQFRELAAELSCARLIWEVLQKTHAFGLIGAMPEGSRRVQNLILFHQYAMNFGGTLFDFLRHLAHLAELDKDLPGYSEESRNSVQIMSIHKSKGLEFPIVFVSNCNRQFNLMDFTEPILIHPKLGLGLQLRDLKYRSVWPTMQRVAIQTAMEAEMKSEEIRLLYVAMTRPKDKLILTCALPEKQKPVLKIAEHAALGLFDASPSALSRVSSVLTWAVYPALLCDQTVPLKYELTPVPKPSGSTVRTRSDTRSEAIDIDFAARFSYEYPHAAAINYPSKITATGARSESISPAPTTFELPELFRTEAALSAAERGSAIHRVMQLVDFHACSSLQACQKELLRLKSAGHLTEAEFAVIPPEQIIQFVGSDLGKRALRTNSLVRESRFSVLLPAPELPDETVLLQGMIDLYFEEPDGLVIVDFKSDHSSRGAKEKYAAQLEAYAQALAELTGKPIKETALFFLSTGETVIC